MSGDKTTITTRLIYDMTVAPPAVPPGEFAPSFVSQWQVAQRNDITRPAPKPRPLSAFVFAIPDDSFGFEVFDDQPRSKRKIISENASVGPPPTAAAQITSIITSADGGLTVRNSKLVYDMTAGAVGVVTTTTPIASTITSDPGGLTVIGSRLIYDMSAGPIGNQNTAFTQPPTVLNTEVNIWPRWKRFFRDLNEIQFIGSPPALPTISSTITGTGSGNMTMTSRMIYDMSAGPVGTTPSSPAPALEVSRNREFFVDMGSMLSR